MNARKREDERFTDIVDRLLDETTADRREGFGMLDTEAADELKQAIETSHRETGMSLAERQWEALEELSETGDIDETA